jgi:hypothetical protein
MVKKARKLWLTFVVATILGIVGGAWTSLVPCWDFCPQNYPDDRDKCQQCCDEKCPNAIAKDKCYTNCP